MKLRHHFALFALFALGSVGCSGGGGSGGGATLAIYSVEGSGPVGVEGSIKMSPAQGPRELSVIRSSAGELVEDLTAGVTWEVDDATVAAVVDGALQPLGAGTTTLRATASGFTLETPIDVVPAATSAIVGVELGSRNSLAVDLSAPVSLVATGELETAERVGVNDRLTWESTNTGVATVSSIGVVTPVSEGRTTIRAHDPIGGHEDQLELHVAPPRPSGALLQAVEGGRVTNGATSVYVAPGALDADVGLLVAAPLAENQLLSPVPAGHQFVTAVTVSPTGVLALSGSLEVTVQTSAAPGVELARVFVLSPTATWDDDTVANVEPDGTVRFWVDHLSTFLVAFQPGYTHTLASQYSPNLVVDASDIYPIAFDDLVAASDLHERTFFGTNLIGQVTSAQLNTLYDDTRFQLRLQSGHKNHFKSNKAAWSGSALGGMLNLNDPTSPQPVVYYDAVSANDATYGDVIVLQYWFLYAASGKAFAHGTPIDEYSIFHEGDLEMVQVVLDKQGSATVPVAATASQHYYGESRHWRDLQTQGTHPVVYVAKASHATFLSQAFEGGGARHTISGSTHAGFGPEGFLAKISLWPWWQDETPVAPVTLSMATPTSSYALTCLDVNVPETEALEFWLGTIGPKGLVPMIFQRGPGPSKLNISRNPMSFHHAYDFSTRNAIRAYEEATKLFSFPGSSSTTDFAIGLGERMLELQEYYADQYVDPCSMAPTVGVVQQRVDRECAPGDQPARLQAYIEGGAAAPGTAQYFPCLPSPTASISSPPHAASYQTGIAIAFQGTATEPECRPLAIDWTSSADGPIGTGTSFSLSTLSVGVHHITMTVTTPEGVSASASVIILVTAATPGGGGGNLSCQTGVDLVVTDMVVQGQPALRIQWCTGNNVIQAGGFEWTLQAKGPGVCPWYNQFSTNERTFDAVIGNGLGSNYCLRVIVQPFPGAQGGGCETGIIASDTDGTDC
jgi:hypothetical protein